MKRLLCGLGLLAALVLVGVAAGADDQDKGEKKQGRGRFQGGQFGKMAELFKDTDALFKKLDADKNGKISKDEFRKLADSAPDFLKDRPEILDRIFDRLDANKDGSLTAEELKKGADLGRGFGGGQPGGRPGIGGRRGGGSPRINAEEIFKKLDTNGDGKLTMEEFKKITEILEQMQQDSGRRGGFGQQPFGKNRGRKKNDDK
ncbi:MAG TPA: EF-hand domain-containing protein [Gemmataceae bacterium]|nr:EF-hand domain-containing protein [Gemmataceae bacterium]